MTTSQLERNKLIEEGQGLVYTLATRIHRKIPVRVDFEDLVAYGTVGLSQAARDFDSEFGTQFSTFAWYRIQGAIYDGISKMSWASRAAYRRARFHQTAGEVLDDDSNAASHNPDETVEEGAQWFRDIGGKLAVVYFASQVENVDSIFQDSEETAPSVVARREVIDQLVKLVNELPEQARILIGTIYFDGATLQEAANRMGISKSWASRIHAKILEQLAKSLRSLGAGD